MARKTINLNKPQQRLVIQQPAEATSVWSRGTGKSTQIAYIIHQAVQTMPRSSWAIVGESYKQILTRTLPGTLAALEKNWGYRFEKDFYIRKKPPAKANFKRPFEPPVDYDHYMVFKNGTGFHLASLDPGGGSTRGLNIDGIITDETLLISGKKKQKFDSEVSATNRGTLSHFSHLPWHHGIFHFTSMPTNKEADWILKAADYYQEEKFRGANGVEEIQDFRALRDEIIDLELKFIQNKDVEYRIELWKLIRELKLKLRFFKSKSGLLYSEADIFDNIENVGIKYVEQQYRDLPDYIFLVEILNKQQKKIEGGFYAHFDRNRHGYQDSFNNSYLANEDYGSERLQSIDSRMDGDILRNEPLRIAVDWGSRINCLTVCQYLKSINELRFLKNFYVKRPKILDHLAEEFCEYYRFHSDKTCFFTYDHTGNTKMANSETTFADQFAKILRAHGWTVRLTSKQRPPTHATKFLLWNKILRENDPALPRVRFNLNNCRETVVSMEQAPANDTGRGIEKNKSSERSEMPQEEATHLSDTADIQVTSLFLRFLDTMPGFVDTRHL